MGGQTQRNPPTFTGHDESQTALPAVSALRHCVSAMYRDPYACCFECPSGDDNPFPLLLPTLTDIGDFFRDQGRGRKDGIDSIDQGLQPRYAVALSTLLVILEESTTEIVLLIYALLSCYDA